MSVDPLSSKAPEGEKAALIVSCPLLPAQAELPSQLPLQFLESPRGAQQTSGIHEAIHGPFQAPPGWEPAGLGSAIGCVPQGRSLPSLDLLSHEDNVQWNAGLLKVLSGFFWLSPRRVAGLESGLSSRVAPFVSRSRLTRFPLWDSCSPSESWSKSSHQLSVPGVEWGNRSAWRGS